MEPTTGKKIVSKGEYVRRMFLREAWMALCIFHCIVVVCQVIVLLPSLIILSILDGLIRHFPRMLYAQDAPCHQTTSHLLMLMKTPLRATIRAYKAAENRANQINLGVPLTRFNTADLPAPDSLVRASSEPMQAQQAVLLRAAAEGQDRHEEELVRAVEGQRKV